MEEVVAQLVLGVALLVGCELALLNEHGDALEDREGLGAEGDGRLRQLADGEVLDRLVADPHLVGRVGDVHALAPGLPRHLEAAALVEASLASEADTRGLRDALLHARGEEAAAVALLARMHEVAAAWHDLALGVLDREDAARAVDAGLRALELGRVELGLLEPADGDGHLDGVGSRFLSSRDTKKSRGQPFNFFEGFLDKRFTVLDTKNKRLCTCA